MPEPDMEGRLPAGLVLDSLEEIFFVCTAEGKLVEWNRRAREVTGYASEELAQMPPAQLVPEEQVEEMRRQIQAVLEEGRARFTAHLLAKDGEKMPCEFTGFLLERGEEQLICLVGRDATGHRRSRAITKLMQEVAGAANEAESFEEALQEAIDAVCEHTGWPVGHVYRPSVGQSDTLSPTSIWNRGSEDRFDVFRQVTEKTSFERGEGLPGRMLQSGDPAWIPDVTEDPNFPRARLAEDSGVKGAFAFPVPMGGEVVAVLEFFSQADETPDKELLEAMGSVGVQLSRVAEREQAEEALRESEEKFRALTEKAVVGVVLIQDDQFQYVNGTFAQMLGYTPEELIGGKHPLELIHPDDRPLTQKNLRRRLEGEIDKLKYQVRGLTKEKETIFVEVYSTRIRYRGRPAVISSVLDITKQRRLQQEILRIQEMERQRIGQELHDGVGSQLTGITMLSEALVENLKEGTQISPEQLEEIIQLIREADQQTRRLSRGLNPVEVGGEGLPAALEKLAERGQKQSELTCRAELKGELPELDEQTATHLYRIAQEAMNNAIKHAQASRIWIQLAAQNGHLKFSVSDDGKGMPEAAERAEGIGLHTMRYRADLIGGRLEIKTAPGQGTTIRCELRV